MPASIKVTGVRELRHRLDAVEQTPKTLGREWALRTVAFAKQDVRRATGNTARTIRVASVSASGATVTAGGAAIFLEQGTRPHIIRPRRARVLRFPAQGSARTLAGRARAGASVVFARLVRHPGTKPYPFMLPSGRKALEDIGVQRFIDAWNKAG